MHYIKFFSVYEKSVLSIMSCPRNYDFVIYEMAFSEMNTQSNENAKKFETIDPKVVKQILRIL